ncbi:N-glycosylase/DNA lyase-like [Styela clava]
MDKQSMISKGWKSISCDKNILNIDYVLCSGQSFRWKKVDGIWVGVHQKKLWKLKQDNDCIWFRVAHNTQSSSTPSLQLKNDKLTKANIRKRSMCNPKQKTAKVIKLDKNNNHTVIDADSQKNFPIENEFNEEAILCDYFQLDIDLNSLCKSWSNVDKHFTMIHKKFPGIRMLRQDPVENLFSFICSSNNNISRISSMVENMCSKFGDVICKDGEITYHSFPTVDSFAKNGTEEVLRGLGFGYRAKYIYQTAIQVRERGGAAWLNNLRLLSYCDAHSELVKLPGIGAKVADCICMMSLDKPNAIPVDTHVWQIAVRDYDIKTLKKTKTLTATSYRAIGEHFRNLWGGYASWAMNFLFVADLKQFKHPFSQK